MIAVAQLNSEFLFQNVRNVDLVNRLKGYVIAVICDNNCTNQALFKKFDTAVKKYLLYSCFSIMYIYLKLFTITEVCPEFTVLF